MKRTVQFLTVLFILGLSAAAFAQGADAAAVRQNGLASNTAGSPSRPVSASVSPRSAVASARVALRPPRSTVSPATRAPLVRSAAR